MARPRKYKIELTDDELKFLKSIIRKNKTSKTIRSRCQIVIDLDEAHGKTLTHEQSAKSNGICLATLNSNLWIPAYFIESSNNFTKYCLFPAACTSYQWSNQQDDFDIHGSVGSIVSSEQIWKLKKYSTQFRVSMS